MTELQGTVIIVAVVANLALTAVLFALRIHERRLAARLAAEQAQEAAGQVQLDRDLVDKLERENIQGPKLPAATALIASARDELEKGPLSGRTRTFVTVTQAQLTDINDAVSAIKLKTEMARKERPDG